MKKISNELYQAYLLWTESENRSTDLHHALVVLTNQHLGQSHDRIDDGELLVQLARMRINGESPSGKAPVSGTDSVGSNPTSPKKILPPKPEPPKVRLLKEGVVRDKEDGRKVRKVQPSPMGEEGMSEDGKKVLKVLRKQIASKKKKPQKIGPKVF